MIYNRLFNIKLLLNFFVNDKFKTDELCKFKIKIIIEKLTNNYLNIH